MANGEKTQNFSHLPIVRHKLLISISKSPKIEKTVSESLLTPYPGIKTRLFFIPSVRYTRDMHLPISVIIPTLNEEHSLPQLLRSLENQTMPPSEIIVADAFSSDTTRSIARQHGCIVVNGGLPGKGRNAGANVASKNLLLFLDADVILPKKFLEKTYFEMVEKDLDVASCLATTHSKDAKDKVILSFWNSYFLFLENVSPHVCGFCIFARKPIHRRLKGFDETILVGEDVDYVQRATEYGKFKFLSSQKIPISLRRFIEEGRLKMVMKHIGITLHMLFIGKIRNDIFDYKFGEHREL